jgi:autotransporter-associated beta strand protein
MNCRVSLKRVVVTVAIVLLSSMSAQAIDWTGGTADMNDPSNWGGTLPTAATGVFHETGSHSPVMNSNFDTRALYFDEDVVTPYTITGTGVLSITQTGFGSAGGYISNASDVDVTIDVAQLNLTRTNGFVTGDYSTSDVNSGTGNLIIGSSGGPMLFVWGGASTSHNPRLNASFNSPNAGTTITIYPKIDFSTVTSTTNSNQFSMNPGPTSTIKLLGGITGGPAPSAGNPADTLLAAGNAGGITILGDSTGWLGRALVRASDLEINHNDSLGVPGSVADASYTWIEGSANTGALRLTNNVTSGEYVYITCRNTADAPHIRNISGSNTLTNELNDDNNITGFTVLSSDGTAVGDLLTIQGNIVRTGGFSSDLVLRGAGKAVVSGNIFENGGTWSSVTKSGAGTWTLGGTNTYTGSTIVEAGTLSLGSAGSISNSPTIQIKMGATLDVSSQAGFTIGSASAQTLKGDGSITGSVTIVAGSALAVDYAGSVIDSLAVSGALTITGATIDFNDVGGALTGGPHVIATYGSLVGTFGTTLDLPLGYILDYDYLGNQIALVSSAHPGDFDSDGDVDGADFVAWQTNFPTTSGATLAQGDADGDGDVDGADFVVWQTNFPFTPGPGASPVPEPVGFVLLGAGGLGLGLIRRRQMVV